MFICLLCNFYSSAIGFCCECEAYMHKIHTVEVDGGFYKRTPTIKWIHLLYVTEGSTNTRRTQMVFCKRHPFFFYYVGMINLKWFS